MAKEKPITVGGLFKAIGFAVALVSPMLVVASNYGNLPEEIDSIRCEAKKLELRFETHVKEEDDFIRTLEKKTDHNTIILELLANEMGVRVPSRPE